MKKYLITVSREFGCDAREISRNIAAELGIEFYDKDLVDAAAQRAGIGIDYFLDADKIVNKGNLSKMFGYGSSHLFYSKDAVRAQAEVIREFANRKQSGLFFGRCADYILREYPNIFKVYLYAPLKFRVQHMAEAYELTEKEAEKLVKTIDNQRADYYKFVTGEKRGSNKYNHIMLDGSEFGQQGCIEMICGIVRKKYM